MRPFQYYPLLFKTFLSGLHSNIIIPEWLWGNLGQIWRFAAIPWNSRWILLKGNGISEQLFSACHFLEEKCSFLTLFCSRSNNLQNLLIYRAWERHMRILVVKKPFETKTGKGQFRFRRVIFPCHFAVACSSVCSLSGFKAREGSYSRSLALPLCSPQSSVLRYWSTLEVEHRKW